MDYSERSLALRAKVETEDIVREMNAHLDRAAEYDAALERAGQITEADLRLQVSV